MCARLKYSLYGTRDAAQNWQLHVVKVMKKIGFTQGKTNPCVFHHDTWEMCTFVHGDDFVTAGSPEALIWFEQALRKEFEMTSTTLGPEAKDKKTAKILNRLVTWDESKGILYEADPRHAELLIKEVLGESPVGKPAVTPGIKVEQDSEALIMKRIEDIKKQGAKIKNEEVLTPERKREITQYKSIAARANFLAMDRADLQYSDKEIARKMCAPDEDDWNKLKRLASYLRGKPRLVSVFKFVRTAPKEKRALLEIYTDSDWAGCKRTRRSTTGGCALFNGCLVKSWSTTQALIALSSGEAELYGVVRASAEGL